MHDRRVYCSEGDVATIEQVMSLIVKLPYLAAVELAHTLQGDVDKMVDGANNWLNIYPEKEDDDD